MLAEAFQPTANTVATAIENAQIVYVEDFGFLAQFFLPDGMWIGPSHSGVDIETEGVLSPHDGEIATVQIEIFGMCWVVHWRKELTLIQVPHVAWLRYYLEHPGVTKVIHNAKFEQTFFLKAFGMELHLGPVHDTMAGEYILLEGHQAKHPDTIATVQDGVTSMDPNPKAQQLMAPESAALGKSVLRRYGVEMDKDTEIRVGFRRKGVVETFPARIEGGAPRCVHPDCPQLAQQRVGSSIPKFLCNGHAEDIAYKRLTKRDTLNSADYCESLKCHGDLNDRQLRYAAFDALWCAQLARDQNTQLRLNQNIDGHDYIALLKLDSNAAEALARMEVHGMPINQEDLWWLNTEWTLEEESLRDDIQDAVWQDGDSAISKIGSNPAMVIKLNKLGFPVSSYDAAELKKFRGHSPIDKILRWKTIKKLQSTYTNAFIQKIHSVTKRIHCSFNQYTTTTGRLSSSGPNLQNIPARTPEGRRIRGCIVAPDGYTFVIADYSNIEMRLIAEMFHDDNMIKAFNEGLDVHTMLAAKIRGMTYEQFKALVDAGDEQAKDDRGAAKPANFGLGYGAGVAQLMTIAWTQYDLDWSKDFATRIRSDYLALWYGVSNHHKRIGNEIKLGAGCYTVATQDGRKRRIEREWHDKDGRRKSCYAAALNHPIQGSSGDMLKKVMVALCRRVQLVLQIHDELVLICKESEAEATKALLVDTMMSIGQTYFKKLPVACEAKISKTWSK